MVGRLKILHSLNNRQHESSKPRHQRKKNGSRDYELEAKEYQVPKTVKKWIQWKKPSHQIWSKQIYEDKWDARRNFLKFAIVWIKIENGTDDNIEPTNAREGAVTKYIYIYTPKNYDKLQIFKQSTKSHMKLNILP